MFKIVDDFNGNEDDTLYDTVEEAEEVLRDLLFTFYKENHEHTQCGLTIVSGEADWYFDPRYNKFIWG